MYAAIDNLIMEIWPRTADYRRLGCIVSDDRNRFNAERDLSDTARNFLEERESDALFRAYWEVPAHYCLIHVDVFGLNANSEEARQAALEIGRTFQWLKTADDISEDSISSKNKLEGLLHLSHLLLRQEPENPAEVFLTEEYNSFISQFSEGIRRLLFRSYIKDIMQCSKSDYRKCDARGDQGYLFGEVEYAILKKYLSGMPEHARLLFALNGAAAAYFDDFKDFKIDIQNGSGYQGEMRPELLKRFVQNTMQSIGVLSQDERKRHFAFLMLGALYQLKELLGLKERT